ncbi:MAG: hypothetical protein OXH68_04375 [Gammaproteobacteria bacterium]|nr:hypothetical protein [Gammaproteobacteria bacterium]
MKTTSRWLLPLVAAALFAVAGLGEAKARFVPVEVILNSPEPVAAWQFELKDRNASMKVVGVENGGSDVFQRAPYYDREAVTRGDAHRIVVADYSLAEEDELPSGRVRVATLHLMLAGDADFELNLVTATTADGRAIETATVSLQETQTREP